MKFTVQFKDPDSLLDCIQDAVKDSLPSDLDDDEKEALTEVRTQKILSDLCDKWFEYGECLKVEIDTEAETCTVVEQKD